MSNNSTPAKLLIHQNLLHLSQILFFATNFEQQVMAFHLHGAAAASGATPEAYSLLQRLLLLAEVFTTLGVTSKNDDCIHFVSNQWANSF